MTIKPTELAIYLYRDMYECGVVDGWIVRPVKDGDKWMTTFAIEPYQEPQVQGPQLPMAKRVQAGPTLSRLCYLRRQRRFRQADVATWVNVPCSSLSSVERGERRSWSAMRTELARLYQVSVVQLFDEDGVALPTDDAWISQQAAYV